MQDRRESVRDKVFLGGVAEINQAGSRMDCVVRNFSDQGASVEFDSAKPISEQMNLTIARKGRSYGIHLILASQTISGIEALFTKTESIFGQFPLRVALAGGGVDPEDFHPPSDLDAFQVEPGDDAVVGEPESEVRVVVQGQHVNLALSRMRDEW